MIIKELMDLVKREWKIKTKKKTILRLVIEIGAAVAVGAAAGIFLTLRPCREKQMNLESDSTVDSIKRTIQNRADDVLKTIDKKTKEVIKDVRQGYKNLQKDINKTVKNVSKELD